jgi:hypothetical protein
MTELGFLLTLLIDHKLPKVTREAVASRLKEVEGKLAHQVQPQAAPYRVQAAPTPPAQIPAHLVGQSASTIAAMMRHEAAGNPAIQPAPLVVENEAIPVVPAAMQPAVIAQTPAAQAAMNERNQVIAAATLGGPFTGKPSGGRTSPRKF